MRWIASPTKGAIDRTRTLDEASAAAVGWIESVITSSLSAEELTRATAPPDSTP